MEQTIGRNDLGSGTKDGQMKVNLHGFRHSYHNLDEIFISDAAPGVLIPCYYREITKESSLKINIDHAIQTEVPEGNPWAAFKLQVDFFEADPRLYIRKLHNNLTGAGLKPEEMFLPQIELKGTNPSLNVQQPNQMQIDPSSLPKYMGISGLGRDPNNPTAEIVREFNALPFEIYYDAFKIYYANKQEENAYIIGGSRETRVNAPGDFQVNTFPEGMIQRTPWDDGVPDEFGNIVYTATSSISTAENNRLNYIDVWGNNLLSAENEILYNYEISWDQGTTWTDMSGGSFKIQNIEMNGEGYADSFRIRTVGTYTVPSNIIMLRTKSYLTGGLQGGIGITAFPLANIDKMREDLLGQPTTAPVVIKEGGFGDYLPYSQLLHSTGGARNNTFPMNGLVLRQYKSDLFNNMMNSERIDGENGVTALTQIDVSNGSFSLDTFNAMKHIYNQMNRIAITGGDWADYERVSYGGSSSIFAETPIFIGGMSADIYFNEQLAQAADAGTPENDGGQLGYVGGVGRAGERRGGHVRVTARSAVRCIMGIMSIVPKQMVYTQGNGFHVNKKSYADYHQPIYDGMGFQDAITEWKAAWDTTVDMTPAGLGNPNNGGNSELGLINEAKPTAPTLAANITQYSSGKQPAFIEYMSSVDKAYGRFCNANDLQYRIISRRFKPNTTTGRIDDDTTYIDPRICNHIFRYSALDARNFQIMLRFKIKHMFNGGAVQIPTF